MPEKTPPTYRWTVSLADGSMGSVVDAAYPVLDDGHMLLKDSDHKIVFAAAPGTGCTFTRGGVAGDARGRSADFAPDPPPVTFAEFQMAWGGACARAWDDDHRHPAVLLPDFMWPGIAEMVNPVTGKLAEVIRVHTFPVQNDSAEDDGDGVRL